MLHLWRHAADWACPSWVARTIGHPHRRALGEADGFYAPATPAGGRDWRAWWAEQMRRPIQ
jgi:hypothetical protein